MGFPWGDPLSLVTHLGEARIHFFYRSRLWFFAKGARWHSDPPVGRSAIRFAWHVRLFLFFGPRLPKGGGPQEITAKRSLLINLLFFFDPGPYALGVGPGHN